MIGIARAIAGRLLLAAAVLAAGGLPIATVSAGAVRLVDGDGVLHLTNVPTDPRYRGQPGITGISVRVPPTDRSASRYAAEIQEISARYGVSAALVEAVVRTESGFDPAAVSAKGAGGLMQLMPGTAQALGVVDRFDPRDNIIGGVRHLRYLLDRYQGSLSLALAAYNAGEGVVDTYRGVPPYPETQQYVRQVLRRAGLSDSAVGTPQTIYRYSGPDNVLTYGNVPPR
jgi:soluble lytic murein transglycosylase-like protein